MKRREFLTAASGLAVASTMSFSGFSAPVFGAKSIENDSLKQPPLPYGLDALAPFLSEEQMRFHYEKHHAGYFKKLSELLEGKPQAGEKLEEIVKESKGPLFNNAAQAWNHSFFWNCMSPNGGGKPGGKLAAAIEKDFGDFTKFQEQFKTAAATLFGSGWVWLAASPQGKLEIVQSSNAETPLTSGKKPILTLDVWEHAYYIDYRNDRAKYIAAFMEKINWPFAESRFA